MTTTRIINVLENAYIKKTMTSDMCVLIHNFTYLVFFFVFFTYDAIQFLGIHKSHTKRLADNKSYTRTHTYTRIQRIIRFLKVCMYYI